MRSTFTVNYVSDKAIYITDNCDEVGCMSVTNDAEQVVEFLYKNFGDKKIFYKDTMGQWDELVHDKGKFVTFAPGVNLA